MSADIGKVQGLLSGVVQLARDMANSLDCCGWSGRGATFSFLVEGLYTGSTFIALHAKIKLNVGKIIR